jgi:hypothetical protein
LVLLAFVSTLFISETEGFSSRLRSIQSPSSLLYSKYGRGAEIWPECNEYVVTLADSFPNGEVPYQAFPAFQERVNVEAGSRKTKRQIAAKTIKRILRRAAAREELDSEEIPANTMERTPSVLALALLFRGLVRPLDVLLVSFLTSYFVILGMTARAPRYNGIAPILPALPPTGHVPSMVSNPMGVDFSYSKSYDRWLKLGVFTGVLGPLLLLGRYIYKNEMVAARMCARPIFLLCCQAISEAFSRRVMVSSTHLIYRYAEDWSCTRATSHVVCIRRHFQLGF